MKTNVKTLAKILALSAGCSLVAMSHADNTITFTGTVPIPLVQPLSIMALQLLKWALFR
jgi:hypothetical protein